MIADVLLTACAICVLTPISLFCLECWAALLPPRKRPAPTGAAPRVAVLVPAHDEELLIDSTVRGLLRQLPDDGELIVIADNCTDNTASLARAAGATVLERRDPTRRGKSHALQYAVDRLSLDPPDVLVVVDADCRVAEGTVSRISSLAHETGRPVQAANTVQADPAAGSLRTVSVLGFRFKNVVRPRGLSRLGWPCLLTGTGMALPWNALRDLRLDNGSLIEDAVLGIDLVIAGSPPLYCEEAAVTSDVPRQDAAFFAQRRRWEHGYLVTMMTQIPRLLTAAVRRRSLAPLAAALDLSIPPLSLLMIGWLLTVAAAAGGAFSGASIWPLLALLAGGVLMALTIVAGWSRFCRAHLPWTALCAAPWYLIRKIPLYASFLYRRQREWTRTGRDPLATAEPPSA